MAVVMGNGSNVAGQERDCVHNTQVPEPSRMTDEHVCHVQHGCCMCPAKMVKDSAAWECGVRLPQRRTQSWKGKVPS